MNCIMVESSLPEYYCQLEEVQEQTTTYYLFVWSIHRSRGEVVCQR